MGEKMRKPPIFYTIAQVRFNPILGMGKHVGDIQDQLRQDFPDFRQEATKSIQISATSVDRPEMKTESSWRWHFIDSRKRSGYILYPDSLIFHTTDYATSDVFFRSVLLGIE